ncbi:uncharacterized protein AB675_165 [Cyphellophora attinorum]|uniref:BTB domain-containing protein n=1 Tax=Cyphellophora attinorum TaxID=1664694 RepID=A0A0N1HQJ2_9EURO|nr:uncharacterized protein AB675_165 [Phialophora attinorum]KPI37787.1 hypothetical protein AB675_165 [Phialophora attinorum]
MSDSTAVAALAQGLSATRTTSLADNIPFSQGPDEGEETIAVYNTDTSISRLYYISKSVLIAESDYFKAMFRNPCKETMSSKVELEGDGDTMNLVLYYLRGPRGSKLQDRLGAWWDREHYGFFEVEDPWQIGDEDNWDDQRQDMRLLNELIDLYVIADKYLMDGLRKICTEEFFPRFLMILLNTHGDKRARAQYHEQGFLKKFFRVVCDRLGDFPEDLFDLYKTVLLLNIRAGQDAEAMFVAAAEYPELRQYVAKLARAAMKAIEREFWRIQSELESNMQECDNLRIGLWLLEDEDDANICEKSEPFSSGVLNLRRAIDRCGLPPKTTDDGNEE